MQATDLKKKFTTLLPGALLALALLMGTDAVAQDAIDSLAQDSLVEHTGEASDSLESAAGHNTDNTSENTTGHATDSHGEGEHADDGHGAQHELPNILQLITAAIHLDQTNPELAHLIHYWENVFFALLAGLFLIVIAQRVYSRRQMIPGKLQNLVEVLVEYFYDFFHSILGDQTKRFLPFLGTLFFYILTMNFMGLIPGFKAASSSINITASLAILTFIYAQYVGFKELGFKGWADHLMGQPRDAIGWAMVPLLLPIHIIGELAKPFSLAVRLFGNITGEDVLIFAFVGLGLSITASMGLEMVGLPLQMIFIPLAILFSTIQALVFTVLSTIYIAMMLPHEEAHH